MIVEGIVTSVDAFGTVNIAPMGPIVAPDFTTLVLRPFPTSTTCANLLRNGQGVFHVTDDVELLARAAVGRIDPPPCVERLAESERFILPDACRWYAFAVRAVDTSEPRVRLDCEVIARGTLRDFLGFNRAKHAVVEAAILATRVSLLPPDSIRDELARLQVIVDKTAGPAERRAMAFLTDYLREVLA